jgi:acid phosphatase
MAVTRRTLIGAVPLVGLAARVRAASPSLNFVAVGDWGRDGASHQRDVAAAMGAAAAAVGSAFTVSTGDNFYEKGVQTATDAQWATSFEDVYTHPALAGPWHVVLGNHDYRGVPQAELDYAVTHPRWGMPARYYTQRPAPFVEMFFLDTSPLVHKYRNKVDSAIAHNVTSQDVGAQLAWLDAALAISDAAWKIVVGHHTIRSGGSEHGDTPELVELVLPILKRRGAQIYLNGHEHDLQHIARDGIDFICSGAGSEVRPTGPTTGTKFALARSGFAVVGLDAHALQLDLRDFTGASVYRTAIVRA